MLTKLIIKTSYVPFLILIPKPDRIKTALSQFRSSLTEDPLDCNGILISGKTSTVISHCIFKITCLTAELREGIDSHSITLQYRIRQVFNVFFPIYFLQTDKHQMAIQMHQQSFKITRVLSSLSHVFYILTLHFKVLKIFA